MSTLSRIAGCCVLATLLSFCACSGDNDDDDAGGCSFEACQAICEETFAVEMDSCGGICELESYCLTTGECDCSFYPCGDNACLEWCLENTDLTQGGCGATSGNLMSCDCY
jgi:hypothetical protein